MDTAHFDRLTRSLSLRGPRRLALTAALGILGLGPVAAVEGKTPKKCKGLKGKKKRKCLDRNKPAVCQNDTDCPDKADSCQNGRCQRICPEGACGENCLSCLVQLTASGKRERRCANFFTTLINPAPCASDAECPLDAPLCISPFAESCTVTQCGQCSLSVSLCEV